MSCVKHNELENNKTRWSNEITSHFLTWLGARSEEKKKKKWIIEFAKRQQIIATNYY